MRKNKEVFPETTATKFKSLWWNNYPLGGYSVSKTDRRQRRGGQQAVLCCAHLNTESNEGHRLLKEHLCGLSSSWVKLISGFSQKHQLSSQITDITSRSFDGGYDVLDNLYQVTIYEMFDFLTKKKNFKTLNSAVSPTMLVGESKQSNCREYLVNIVGQLAT